jgi:hypothetical protein
MAVFAPIPNARDRTTRKEKPGERRRVLIAKRKSCHIEVVRHGWSTYTGKPLRRVLNNLWENRACVVFEFGQEEPCVNRERA